MTFTLCLLLALAAWVVALGRQAVPRRLRVPLSRAGTGDLARDAVRGARELAVPVERRPDVVPVPGQRDGGRARRRPAAHL